MDKLESLLQEAQVILADGAMGTMLITAGLKQGESPHHWNLDHPDLVAQVHRDYLEAGSRILLTNTFGANRYRMAHYDARASIFDLNRTGAEILRSEVETTDGIAIVAGDMGPSGHVLAPFGDLSFEQARDAFADQAAGLIEGGVDVVWVETMADLEEVRAAFEGIRSISEDVPILTTMTFDTHGRTLMGITPAQACQSLLSMGAAAVGGNCGVGPDEMMATIDEMHSTEPDAILVAKANAGVPQVVEGNTIYDADPPTMANYAVQAHAAGARIVGACCGSTPAHIHAMANALSS